MSNDLFYCQTHHSFSSVFSLKKKHPIPLVKQTPTLFFGSFMDNHLNNQLSTPIQNCHGPVSVKGLVAFSFVGICEV